LDPNGRWVAPDNMPEKPLLDIDNTDGL
jgi:hypothetical protein